MCAIVSLPGISSAAGYGHASGKSALLGPVEERGSGLRWTPRSAPGRLVRRGQELGPAEQRLVRNRFGSGLFGGGRGMMPAARNQRGGLLSAR